MINACSVLMIRIRLISMILAATTMMMVSVLVVINPSRHLVHFAVVLRGWVSGLFSRLFNGSFSNSLMLTNAT